MNKWIKCSEQLPDFEAGYVLVACKGGCVDKSFFSVNRGYLASLKNSGRYSRKYQGKESGFFEISHRYGYVVTHWMPLPPLPEDDV